MAVIVGKKNSETLVGTSKSDTILAFGGNDVLDGAAGSDLVTGGSGNDVFIHRIAENAGSKDLYEGGLGQDTLRLVLTAAEWARSDVQADVAAFIAFQNSLANRLLNPFGLAAPFQFKSTNLTVVNIEKLEITVDGRAVDPRNEAVTARADVLAVTEDRGGAIDLLANDTVPDRAASVLLLSTGTYGTATLAPSLGGATQSAVLSYAPSAATQALRAGEVVTDTITYRVVDVNGDASVASVTITIAGVNDAAAIGGTASGAVAEDGATVASGRLTVADADTGENQVVARSGVAGAYGSFGVDAAGAWTYALNNGAANVQALAQGQVATDSFTVVSKDGTASQVVTVWITGTNDAAVIGDPTSASVTEDAWVDGWGCITASGTIAISDVDGGEAVFRTAVVGAAGNLGTLRLQGNGAYTYVVVNADAQSLGAGQTKVDTFTVTALDGTAKQVSFTVTGTNDAAVIGDPAVSSVTEDVNAGSDGLLRAIGRIPVSDADGGEARLRFDVTGAAGNLGQLVLASAGGDYLYEVANGAVQFLGAGQTKVDTFTVTALDGTAKQVSFTVTGTNDAAVIGDPMVSSVTEDVNVGSDGLLRAIGRIPVSDADGGEARLRFDVTGAAGNLGQLVLASAGGDYLYEVANGAVQFLGAGQTKVDTFTVTALDGTAKQVSFTVTGTNDAAVIGDPMVSSVTEDVNVGSDGLLRAIGRIPVSDADGGEARLRFDVTGAAGNLGQLVLASAGGDYLYEVANGAVQFLGAGQTKVDTFTVRALDGTTQEVSFTITGTNDGPVVTSGVANATGTVVEGGTRPLLIPPTPTPGTPTTGGRLASNNVDRDATATWSGSANGIYGSFAIGPDGAWSYMLDNTRAATDALAIGQTATETFTATVTDDRGATATEVVTVKVTGANDAPVVTSTVADARGAVREAGPDAGVATATGRITASDVDDATTTFSLGSRLNVYGTAAVAADGTWTYTLDNDRAATQALRAGETVTERFNVNYFDRMAGGAQEVVVTVTGTNDAPVVTGTVAGSATEDGPRVTLSALTNASDVDAGAVLSVVFDPASLPAGVSYDAASRSFTLDPTAAPYQSLAAGATTAVSVGYGVSDGLTTTPASVRWTVTGTNDAPVVTGPVTGVATEGGAPVTLSALGNASDVDAGAVLSVIYDTASLPAGVTYDAESKSFTLDPSDAAFEALAAGETRQIVVTYGASDGAATTPASVAFTVAGRADGPSRAEVVDLAALPAARGFIVRGEDENVFDYKVEGVGDINGDGFADFLISTPFGRDSDVYAVFGAADGVGTVNGEGQRVVDLRTLTPDQGFVMQGDRLNFNGYAVGGAGDVNGDGLADIVIGAPNGAPRAGGDVGVKAYVVYGSTSGFGAPSTQDGVVRQELWLPDLTADQGSIIQGSFYLEAFFGAGVSGAGDVNGDGIDDLIVGAPGDGQNGYDFRDPAGRAFVVFGQAGGVGTVNAAGQRILDTQAMTAADGFEIDGDLRGDRTGFMVSDAGDVNGDGYADVIVGVPDNDAGGEAGAAFVVFGSAGVFGRPVTRSAGDDSSTHQTIDLARLSPAEGFLIQGAARSDRAGHAVSAAGDVNGDGFADLLVASPRADGGRDDVGEAYVVFGSGDRMGTPVPYGDATRQVVDAATLTPEQGFIVRGATAGDLLGASVSGAGDVNGDGYADILVSTIRYIPQTAALAFQRPRPDTDFDDGQTYLLFGSASGFGAPVIENGVTRQVLDLADLGQGQGLVLDGSAIDGNSGRSVDSAGDVNGDGFDDLLVGASNGDVGATRVLFGGLFGGSAAPVARQGANGADTLVGAAGDDVLVGGGGADVFRGGAGDDRMVAGDAGFRSIDGGSGTDTLAIAGAGQVLDLLDRPLASAIRSVERLDLSGSGAQTVALDRLAVQNLTEVRSDGVATLTITGTADDTVRFGDLGWVAAGEVAEDGRTYAVYRHADGSAELRVEAAMSLSLRIDLAGVTATQGFVITGDAAGDAAGYGVSAAGDVDGDGIVDLLVGTPGADAGGAGSGAAYVVSGAVLGRSPVDGSGRRVLDLASLTVGQGYAINGGSVGGVGASVSAAGDVNGDGLADVIVAQPGDGGAIVVFGKTRFDRQVFENEGFNVIRTFDPATLPGANGFLIKGGAGGDGAGWSVSAAGDVNGDGLADLLIGAPDAGLVGDGETYVVLGSRSGFGDLSVVPASTQFPIDVTRQVLDLSTLTAQQGFVLRGGARGDLAGFSVGQAGDVNGDGLDDILVGAPGAGAGQSYVVYGSADGFGAPDATGRRVLDLGGLSAEQGLMIVGDFALGTSGTSVSAAGDINGDGYDDFVLGAPEDGGGATGGGRVYVLFGSDAGPGTTDALGRRVLDLTALSADQGFVVRGGTAGDGAGTRVGAAGDFNGDGFADVLVGGAGTAGATLLFGSGTGFGRSVTEGGATRQVVDLASLTTDQGFVIEGPAGAGGISSAGDVNRDGFADLLVGAPEAGNAGETYVIFGGPFGQSGLPVTATGTTAADILVGGLAGDVLVGQGGADVFRGGAGDDRLVVGDESVLSVDGGLGVDTLAFGGTELDLTDRAGASRFRSIERVDLSGAGAQTIVLDRLAVQGLGETRSDGRATLVVAGGADDTVRFGEAQWAEVGSVVEGGTAYAVYRHVEGGAEVRIQAGVGVVLTPPPVDDSIVRDLATLSADQGFVIRGDAAGDGAGYSVGAVGDVNGDGVADLIVGAPFGADGGGSAGEAYVVFGSASGLGVPDASGRRVLDLTTLSGAQGFVIQGDGFGDFAGASVGAAGDLNGDGLADIIVGAPGGSDGGRAAGEAYVVFGSTGGFGAAVTANGQTRQVVDLTALSGAQGFIVQGDRASDQAGTSVSAAGDVNGDGYDDLIVGGALNDDGGRNTGAAYVLFGSSGGFGTATVVGGQTRRVVDTTTLGAAQGFVIQGDQIDGAAGQSVSAAGDVNGDGLADLLVGAPNGSVGGLYAGEGYIVFGSRGGFGSPVVTGGQTRQVVNLATLSVSQGLVIQGDAADDRAGTSVSAAGDVNGDGIADFLIGAPYGRGGGALGGEAYVAYGSAGGLGAPVTANGQTRQVLDLSALSPDQGFFVQPGGAAGQLGFSVSGAGDVNGDGFADVLIGAPGNGAGAAYVMFGSAAGYGRLVEENGQYRRVLDLSDLTEAQGFRIQGDGDGDQAGHGVSAAGDVNADGFADILVGAPGGDDGGSDAGEAYVILGGAFGGSTAPVIITGTAGAETLRGGAGDDTIAGLAGDDLLFGGAGRDVFVFVPGAGRDRVADFRIEDGPAQDRLDLRAYDFDSLADVLAASTTRSGDVTIALDANDSVTLMDVTLSDLMAHRADLLLI